MPTPTRFSKTVLHPTITENKDLRRLRHQTRQRMPTTFSPFKAFSNKTIRGHHVGTKQDLSSHRRNVTCCVEGYSISSHRTTKTYQQGSS
ncbi:hypothetical protein ARMSODRAFT_967349, partial [Armillaria solidipes]